MHKNGNTGKDTGRDLRGRFAKGNSGKLFGSRNKTTQAAQGLLESEAEQKLMRKAIDAALEGHPAALRLCMEQILSIKKETPVSFAMPNMNNTATAVQAAGALLAEVASGELTPNQGTQIMGLIESYPKIVEATEPEGRLSALEAASTWGSKLELLNWRRDTSNHR